MATGEDGPLEVPASDLTKDKKAWDEFLEQVCRVGVPRFV